MALLKRWIIALSRSGAGDDWDIWGSVVGPRSSDAALRKARATFPDLPVIGLLQATEWERATEDEREAAALEDNIGVGGTPNTILTDWERDFAQGNLPLWASTPAKGCLYATMSFVWSWAKVIVVILAIVITIRSCMS